MLPFTCLCQYQVSFPGLGIHDLSVSRIAFDFNLFGRHITIYWYGLLFAVALLLCMVLAVQQAKAHRLKGDDILDFFLLMIPFMVIGARLYYVAFEWDAYKDNPARIFDISEGGLAFYGGVIGGMIALFIIAHVKHIKVHHLLDYIAVYVPLGQGIGRWGNFFNQEAFGVNTDLPWGMISEGTQSWLTRINPDPANPLPGLDPNLPVHPTFLYEFLANMVIFAILLAVRRKSDKYPYRTFLTYFLLYGVTRFFVEGIRTDALVFTMLGQKIRVSQLVSLAMVVVAVVFLVVLAIRDKKRKEVLVSLQDAEDTGVLMLFGSEKSPEDDDVVIIEDNEMLDSDDDVVIVDDSKTLDDAAKDDNDKIINTSDVADAISDTASTGATVFDGTSEIDDSDTAHDSKGETAINDVFASPSDIVTSEEVGIASGELSSDASYKGDIDSDVSYEGDGEGQDVL